MTILHVRFHSCAPPESAAARASRAGGFEVLNAIAQGDQVALEIRWTAKLLVPVGSLKPGDSMTARFAFFIKFRGDRIERRHNYDCFDPF